MTCDDLGNFSTHVATFCDLRVALTINGEDTLTTLTTDGEDTLMTPTTSGEDTLPSPAMTCDYLVTTLHDVTDDPCDHIGDPYDIHCPHD